VPNPRAAWVQALLLQLAVILLVLGPASQAFAQRDLEAAYRHMRALRLAGEEEKALVEAEWLEAQVKARSGDQSGRYGTVLNALGIIHEKLGHFERSESFHHQALGIFQKGRDPNLISMSTGNLAVLAFRRGRYAEAEDLYKRAIERCETSTSVVMPGRWTSQVIASTTRRCITSIRRSGSKVTGGLRRR
jgi:tetratricopeptide (TPR) repeat protein